MNTLPFTQEEVELLKSNPYTAHVTENRISFTLNFKIFAIKESQAGLTSVQIFQKAGYDPAVLGKDRIYKTMKRLKKEAASDRGLHAGPKEKSNQKRSEELLNKKRTDAQLKAMQKKILRLEQELEFLKKIATLQ